MLLAEPPRQAPRRSRGRAQAAVRHQLLRALLGAERPRHGGTRLLEGHPGCGHSGADLQPELRNRADQGLDPRLRHAADLPHQPAAGECRHRRAGAAAVPHGAVRRCLYDRHLGLGDERPAAGLVRQFRRGRRGLGSQRLQHGLYRGGLARAGHDDEPGRDGAVPRHRLRPCAFRAAGRLPVHDRLRRRQLDRPQEPLRRHRRVRRGLLRAAGRLSRREISFRSRGCVGDAGPHASPARARARARPCREAVA